MVEKIGLALTIIGAVVEIAPVRVSPLAWLGKRLHRDLDEKIDTLETHIDQIEIDTIRSRILAFDRQVRKGTHLREYEYKAIFVDIDKWVKYHEKYPSLNGMIDVAIENIKDAYKQETFD